eukprot:GHVU01045995.1.p1 GENE.GHVU01045995.1~~GHVU01045995.1.p1  ORF type:complete len:121 (+),score=0.88 GHVU01045995.1:457-819(+)
MISGDGGLLPNPVFLLGEKQVPVGGVLDSGTSTSILGIEVYNRLRDAGEVMLFRGHQTPIEGRLGRTRDQTIVPLTVRVVVDGRIWIHTSNVPFCLVDRPAHTVILGRTVLEVLERPTRE